MREIKFRAWDKHKNKMREVSSLSFEEIEPSENIIVKFYGVNYGLENRSLCELMQFTGLADKNGKEIYEGDIIKVTGEFAIDDSGIIKWSQQEDDYTYHCGFMVDWQEEVKRRSHLSFWANHREIEIIGNRFENPELLKEATV